MSANFLAREIGYQKSAGYGEGGRSVAETYSPAATYAERIDGLFAEVAAMGYRGIDLWTAHCNPAWATATHIDGLLAASQRHGVEIVSLAGSLGNNLEQIEKTCQLARDIRCPLLGLGCAALPSHTAEVAAILDRYQIKLAFENHPEEKTPQHVLEKIGHGRWPSIGVACDTGWWGTHGYPVLDAIDALKEQILLVHLKNVQAPGAHVAARFDEGCVDLRSAVQHLRKIGYSGWISLEYEPFEGDPTDTCREFLTAAKQWWDSAC